MSWGTCKPDWTCRKTNKYKCLTVPHRTTPHHTTPHHTKPHHTTPHHTTPHTLHHIYIYTPLDTDLGQNPVPAKKPCKPLHRSENYFSKWLSRCSVVTSMLTPPTRNHNFLNKFSRVSAISHTSSAAFRCRRTIENAKDIYNFSKQVVISLQRGDIDVHTSYAKPSLFYHFFTCITRLIQFFLTKIMIFHRPPKSNHGFKTSGNLANRIVGLSLFTISMHFVRAWWHRCAPLPHEITTLFSLFRMYHAFD